MLCNESNSARGSYREGELGGGERGCAASEPGGFRQQHPRARQYQRAMMMGALHTHIHKFGERRAEGSPVSLNAEEERSRYARHVRGSLRGGAVLGLSPHEKNTHLNPFSRLITQTHTPARYPTTPYIATIHPPLTTEYSTPCSLCATTVSRLASSMSSSSFSWWPTYLPSRTSSSREFDAPKKSM